jgi:hypothetical protein
LTLLRAAATRHAIGAAFARFGVDTASASTDSAGTRIVLAAGVVRLAGAVITGKPLQALGFLECIFAGILAKAVQTGVRLLVATVAAPG